MKTPIISTIKNIKNYSGIGGDCTNFASQVLADKARLVKYSMDLYMVFSHFSKKEGTSW